MNTLDPRKPAVPVIQQPSDASPSQPGAVQSSPEDDAAGWTPPAPSVESVISKIKTDVASTFTSVRNSAFRDPNAVVRPAATGPQTPANLTSLRASTDAQLQALGQKPLSPSDRQAAASQIIQGYFEQAKAMGVGYRPEPDGGTSLLDEATASGGRYEVDLGQDGHYDCTEAALESQRFFKEAGVDAQLNIVQNPGGSDHALLDLGGTSFDATRALTGGQALGGRDKRPVIGSFTQAQVEALFDHGGSKQSATEEAKQLQVDKAASIKADMQADDGGPSSSTTSTSSVGPQKGTDLQGADAQSADKAIAAAKHDVDPAALAKWLNDHTNEQQQSQFLDRVFNDPELKKSPELLKNILNRPAADSTTRVLAKSLSQAERNGTFTSDELKPLTSAENGMNNSDNGLARIIQKSGNINLIVNFAEQEIDKSSQPGEKSGSQDWNKARAFDAATALAGLSPDELQKFMYAKPDAMKSMLANMPVPTSDVGVAAPGALGPLLKTASAIQPPTAEVLSLFKDAVDKAPGNPAVLQGLVSVWKADSQYLSEQLTSSGDNQSPGGPVLAKFFSASLFTPGAGDTKYDGGGAVKDAVLDGMNTATKALTDRFGISNKQEDAALKLGRLVGAMEGGAALALQNHQTELEKNKEERDKWAGLIGQTVGALVGCIPGASEVAGGALPGNAGTLATAVTGKVLQSVFPDGAPPDSLGLVDAMDAGFQSALNAYDADPKHNDPRLETSYITAYLQEDFTVRKNLGLPYLSKSK